MPSAPMPTPSANAASTTSTRGARHCVPKKKCTVTSCWLFSSNANRVKKMAAFSSHMRYFICGPDARILEGSRNHGPGIAETAGLPQPLAPAPGPFFHLRGALVDRFAQRLARLEMGDALFGNVHAFAAARVAAHARRTPVDREAAETADFDTVPAHQRFAHRVQ